jgi:hypothetical protein
MYVEPQDDDQQDNSAMLLVPRGAGSPACRAKSHLDICLE